VDDDEVMRTVAEQVLKRAGYQVVVMEDAEYSDRAISRLRFDAALVDLGLPGISGQKFIEKLRNLSKSPEAPVFVVTASTDIDVVRSCYVELGARLVVSKPVEWSLLTTKLDEELSIKSRPAASVRSGLVSA